MSHLWDLPIMELTLLLSIKYQMKLKMFTKKYQICLIIGGGNIFRGIKGASEGIDRHQIIWEC